MTDKPLITGRPTLTIDEAVEICNCKVADLFYKAEIGKLTIYAIADGWKVGRITEIDHSMALDQTLGISFRGLDGKPQAGIPCDNESQDMILWGNYITYGRNGSFRDVYQLDLTDRLPVTARTFKSYRITPERATIEIDFNRLYELADQVHERRIYPEPALLVHNLLLNGKLVVMTADIQRLRGLSPDDNLSELFEHEYWPLELGLAISAWQNARDSFQPGDKPSALIRNWLKTKYPKMSDAAVERITTIANWDKKPGPPEKMGGE